MLLAELVTASGRIAETSSRNDKIGLLAAVLRRLRPEEIEIAVRFLSGGARQGRVGIGWASLREARGEPAGAASLELQDVDRAVSQVAAASGAGSAVARREVLRALFAHATAAEQEFLTALLMGELRQGALAGLMVDALAKAAAMPRDRVRRAVMMAGDIGQVAVDLLGGGDAALARYEIKLFRPVQPMLAQTAADVDAALQELGEAALEYKFDGARVQVHRSGDQVAVYSRRMNDVTAAVPEVVEAALALPSRAFIIDGEAISFDAQGRPQPFQVTMRRFGRRLNVERMRAELPLRPVWFDLLHADGGALIDEPQQRRFQALAQLAGEALLAPHLLTSDAGHAAEFVHWPRATKE